MLVAEQIPLSVTSTEIYARLNDEIKRKAIEDAYIELNLQEFPSWQEDATLRTGLGICTDNLFHFIMAIPIIRLP